MTKRQVEQALRRHVAPRFRELHAIGDLLIELRGSIVRGFVFDRSQLNAQGFRLQAWAQLLSVPTPYVSYLMSETLGDFDAGDREGVEGAFTAGALAAQEAWQLLRLADDYASLAAGCARLSRPSQGNPAFLHEVRAHCYVRLGDDAAAMSELALLERAFSPVSDKVSQTILGRVSVLRTALRSGNGGAADTLLDRWTDESVSALGLARLIAD